jgi:type IV fimbrial biogenesis protein FimT
MRKHFRFGCTQQGFTLLELMIAITIVAIVMALTVPGFNEIIERKKLEGAAEKVFADLQFAKTEAIKKNQRVYANFDTTNQCYGLSLASSCACSPTSSCVIDGVDKAVKMSDFGSTSMVTASFFGTPSTEVNFDPRRGDTLNNGSVVLQSPRGKEVRVIVGNLLRIKICSPAGGRKDFTYADCP